MSGSKEYMSRYISDRQLLLKIEAIEYKGGKCQKCGYDKCYAALEFHHRDPAQKEFSWRKTRTKSRETIFKELDKCDLLCANCHREEHHDPELLKAARQRAKERNREPKPTIPCPVCGKHFKPVNKQNKHCSRKCDLLARERVDWPNDLPELVAKSSKRAVARQLGVSDKAVAKRLKNHHL